MKHLAAMPSEQGEGHTHRRYDAELGALHIRVLELGGLAENLLKQSITALVEKDTEIAGAVVARTDEVKQLAETAEAEVVAVIAQRAPVASDLRAILSMSRAISDLFRACEESIQLSHTVIAARKEEKANIKKGPRRDISAMGDLVSGLLGRAIRAFDTFDLDEALRIYNFRPELETELQSALRRLSTFILEDARTVGRVINVVVAIRSLERIGYYVVNIAEYLIVLIAGQTPEQNGDS